MLNYDRLLGRETLRPLLTWVAPGAVFSAPVFMYIYTAVPPSTRTAIAENQFVVGAVLFLAILVSGLILEEIGSSMENRWYDRSSPSCAGKANAISRFLCGIRLLLTWWIRDVVCASFRLPRQNPSGHADRESNETRNFYDYMTTEFGESVPVGHHYLQNFVLRLNFQLSMAPALLLASGFWLATVFEYGTDIAKWQLWVVPAVHFLGAGFFRMASERNLFYLVELRAKLLEARHDYSADQEESVESWARTPNSNTSPSQ